jgi:hypothetical protein
MYNFDEKNWSRFQYQKKISTIGTFFPANLIRIMDLIGTISDQAWTPATLGDMNPYDAVMLGCVDGTPALVDFTNTSEEAWSINGVCVFGDVRHRKTMTKFRLSFIDNGQITFTLTVRNKAGQVATATCTSGTGTGQVMSVVLGFKINGIRLYWEVSGNAGVPAHFVEFAPIYDIGGEQRGAQQDA